MFILAVAAAGVGSLSPVHGEQTQLSVLYFCGRKDLGGDSPKGRIHP